MFYVKVELFGGVVLCCCEYGFFDGDEEWVGVY